MRITIVVLGFLLLVVSSGCAKHAVQAGQAAPTNVEVDRCAAVTNHFVDLVGSSGKLGFAERMMLNAGRGQLADACRKKGGMSAAQAACFLDVKTIDKLDSIDTCPALKEHPIPWLNMSTDHKNK